MRREIINNTTGDMGISLVSCGFEDCSPGFSEPSHKRDHYLIHCVTKGSGTVDIGGITYFVKKGEIFVIRPETAVSYASSKDNTWSFAWFGFRGRDVEFYLKEAGISTETVVKKANTNVFFAAVRNCIDYFDSRAGAPTQAKLSAFLLEVFDSFRNAKGHAGRSEPSTQVDRALEFIEYNYMRGITASDVALQLSIDRTHFFRIFKAKTGISPEQYIMKYRVEKASALLREDKHTVTEIASLVGVSDVYYFSKLFKKNVGKSPTEYKKQFESGENPSSKATTTTI